jgi:CheY-like chemotaxis protein
LNNAAKYTPEGGRIALTAETIGGKVRIRVADNGIGISAEMLDKVFELFHRVDEAIELSQSGLGVGLSLAKQLAELHGGSISASSEGPGLGAMFTVCLPASEAPSDVLTPHQGEGEGKDGSKSRILIVDDNKDAAETLAMLLESLGHTTHFVCEAPKALNVALDFRPDVALLDLGMPELNGFDLARKLRRESTLADLTLVALSGWGTEEDRMRGRDAGIDHHLTKPVLLEDVKAILRHAESTKKISATGISA